MTEPTGRAHHQLLLSGSEAALVVGHRDGPLRGCRSGPVAGAPAPHVHIQSHDHPEVLEITNILESSNAAV